MPFNCSKTDINTAGDEQNSKPKPRGRLRRQESEANYNGSSTGGFDTSGNSSAATTTRYANITIKILSVANLKLKQDQLKLILVVPNCFPNFCTCKTNQSDNRRSKIKMPMEGLGRRAPSRAMVGYVRFN